MEAIPSRFLEWLGAGPFLEVICPTRENRGAVAQLLASLDHSEIAGGRIVSLDALELVRGGLLYAADALSAAHEIFQQNHTNLGSYWHGMMHRREGDFGNACYWFRMAGKIAPLDEMPGFDPVAFTMRCSRSRMTDSTKLAEIQMREWEALINHCLNLAVAQP